jgi:hypothetical protein
MLITSHPRLLPFLSYDPEISVCNEDMLLLERELFGAIGEIHMKRILGLAIILTSLSIPAFAAKNSQTIKLTSATTVGATKLPAGEYKMTWTGTAPDVQVTLVQKDVQKPATVTVAAKQVAAKNDVVQLTTNKQAGENTLQNVKLKDSILNFTSAPTSGQ